MSILASLTSAGAHGGSHGSCKAEIESLFNKIMSPIKKEADPNLVAQFCHKVNADFDGAQIALDLITSKLHNTQEWEVLIVLYVLEACVKNCGDRFHDLIGRFRFLNEMIKVVSPKYFGTRTSERVKKRCVELLYCWMDGLPSKTKIREAYDMLKKQGLVREDPTYVEKLVIDVAPRPKNVVFESEERSRQLAQLLKSKNPQDLEAANRLIKNMVRQDEIKIEKQSNRINELELVNNNVRLLNDMLLNFNRKSSTESERETIKYLYEELQKLRPNLVKLANEADDNDESIGEIIKTNEQCEKIMNQYKLTFLNERAAAAQHDDNLVNILMNEDESSLETIGSFDSLGGNETGVAAAVKSKNVKYDPLQELHDLFSHEPAAAAPLGYVKGDLSEFLGGGLAGESLQFGRMNDTTTNIENLLSSINVSGAATAKPNNLLPDKKPSSAKTPQLRALADLNELGRNLMEKSLTDPKTPLAAAVSIGQQQPTTVNPSTLTLNDLQYIKQSSGGGAPPAAPAGIKTDDMTSAAAFNALNTLFVELESVKPGSISPFVLYDKNNLKIVLYFGRDSPAADVNVIVISATSANTHSVLKNFSFQAAVPKSMKIKLQPPSRCDLPVYNPILPPSVITQVILIANPKKEQIRLKYKVAYSFDDSVYNEPEEVKALPLLDNSLI